MTDPMSKPVYQRILLLVRQIPYGQVATYGQIAWYEGHATPRMVGYALSGLPEGSDVPWQRVINSKGGISPRGGGVGALEQRERLKEEGVQFEPDGTIDIARFGWDGPHPGWLEENGFAVGAPWQWRGK